MAVVEDASERSDCSTSLESTAEGTEEREVVDQTDGCIPWSVVSIDMTTLATAREDDEAANGIIILSGHEKVDDDMVWQFVAGKYAKAAGLE